MKATLVTFKCETDTGRSWDEEIEVPEGYDAESFIKQIIDEFNAEEDRIKSMPDSNPNFKVEYRTFIEIVSIGKKVKASEWLELKVGELKKHDAGKINNVTIGQGGKCYDIWRCKNCKLQFQAIRFTDPEKILSKVCHPERVCLVCNKEFASERNLKSHISIGKHKTPEWCMNPST